MGQSLAQVVNDYHSAWRPEIRKLLEQPTLAVKQNEWGQVLQFGYLHFIWRAGPPYRDYLHRDLGLTAEEKDIVDRAQTILIQKLPNLAGQTPAKSTTKNLYDRIRQIGR